MVGRRSAVGFGIGVLATAVMTVVMLAGVITGLSPMPRPIPIVIVTTLLGPDSPMPVRVFLAIASHLMYGGVWAALLWSLTRSITVGKGVGLGVMLWLIMQIAVLPLLGWGVFGQAVTIRIAIATLLLHLVYGVVLGVAAQSLGEKLRTIS